MEMNLNSCSYENPAQAEDRVEEIMHFDESLKELRALRSQLHDAAEYCEATFLNSKERSIVVENTKDYIRKTMVTVVDHLGNVSAKLDGLISQTNAFSEAESRVQCLKQRLLSCEQYAHTTGLSKMQFCDNVKRYHKRYLSSPPSLERSNKDKLRDSENQNPPKTEEKHVPEALVDLPLFMYTCKPCPASKLKQTTASNKGHHNLATVVPVQDGLEVLTKVPNSSFHFHSTQKVGRHRRSSHGSDLLWRMRRSRRIQ
ncbi:probable protein ABIL5 [Arachis duranensis]|uniref:Probable protein ABIL5 n=1 Tax=Arachis duranensis TaxID=130453 RepID=A0A6P4CN04_ARADU|nr:probable protein ABIL5 [Arachis duranensis]